VVKQLASAVEDLDVASLLDALGRYGLDARISNDAGGGVTIDVAGLRLAVEGRSIVTAADGIGLAKRWRRRSIPVVLVADRIAVAGREALAAAGINYLDRRGALRVMAPPLVIDTSFPAFQTTGQPIPPLSSQVAKEVAIACLLTPNQAHRVREVAAFLNRAPSAVSKAMADLRGEGLLTSQNEPLVPDLFQEMVSVWRVHRVALAKRPPERGQRSPLAADLGFDHPDDSTGWALTDTVAAAAWGMPVVARGDYPPDFYVPAPTALERARRVLGDARNSKDRACTAALAPVRLACLRRVEPPTGSPDGWPLANHIVVALDIAQDKARGLEILDQWNPTEQLRAW